MLVHRDAGMTITTNTEEAKEHLSDLIDRALRGEEVVIARDGVPCVRLIVVAPAGIARQGGEFAGRIHGDIIGGIGDDGAGTWG